MLQSKKILIGISGSIAAYKTILLVRLLVKAGAEVRVVMTPAARDFVSPLVLSTLSKNEVLVDIADGASWANHVMLGRWADLFVISPASCNTIAKMANGICDNLLMAVYLSATCPVMLAPAMDEDMWHHPTTKRNLKTLKQDGCRVLDVDNGELASGLTGPGRMMEPDEIVDAIIHELSSEKPLAGLKVMVTAGPTYEPIDPVRFVGNHSSGLMGIEIARAFMAAGAQVDLILGPSAIEVPSGITITRVGTAQEMFDAAAKIFPEASIAVMAAAVADYRPAEVASQKIKKKEDGLTIELVKNPDILKWCGEHKAAMQLVIGFALETENESENARAKMKTKHADMIILNSLRDEDAGFGKSTNKVTILDLDGSETHMPVLSKKELADQIVHTVSKKWHEKHEK